MWTQAFLNSTSFLGSNGGGQKTPISREPRSFPSASRWMSPPPSTSDRRPRNSDSYAQKESDMRTPRTAQMRMQNARPHGAAHPAGHGRTRYRSGRMLRCMSPVLALLGPREMSDLSPQSGPKRTLMIQIVVTNRDFMSTRPSTTLADFSRARDSQISFSVTHGWSAFWRGRPWLAGRRIGETSSDVGSSRFWIGWVTKHGDKCARSTCRD